MTLVSTALATRPLQILQRITKHAGFTSPYVRVRAGMPYMYHGAMAWQPAYVLIRGNPTQRYYETWLC
jgi:hypothetical protein